MTKACMTLWGPVEAVPEPEFVVDMDMEVTVVVKDTVDMEDTEDPEDDTEDTVQDTEDAVDDTEDTVQDTEDTLEDTEQLVPDSRTASPTTMPKISLTEPMTTRKRHRSGRVETAAAWAVEGLVDSLVGWAVVWAAEWAPEWVVGDSEFRICLGW
ncbi:MAG: hypothetical protein Q9199_006432 [Rusavskia elegans]